VRPPAPAERGSSPSGPLPAGGLHRRGLPAGRGRPAVLARLAQDHRRAAGRAPRVPAAVAAARLLGAAAEQGHHQAVHR